NVAHVTVADRAAFEDAGLVRRLGNRHVRDVRARAARELEVADPSAPVEAAVRGVVLLRVPEGAVVDRVDGYVAVVAPAVERVGGLAAGPVEQVRLALGKL